MVSPSPSPTRTHVDMGETSSEAGPSRSSTPNKEVLQVKTVTDEDELAKLPESKGVEGAALNRPPTRVSIIENSSTSHNKTNGNGTLSNQKVAPPPLARAATSSSNQPYSAFPKSMKWFIVGLSGIAGIFSPISSNIFVPAIPTLATAFNRSQQDISLAVTIYLVFQAVTPSFFGSMSDSFGRRPTYVGTLTIYMGANVGLALCPTNAYWLLLVLRALQATGGSAVISIGAGIVSDIAEPRERGLFFSIFQLGALAGPAFGPLLGGIFAQTLGWRAIFWFLVIATGIVLVPIIFFMPETLRSLVGDGSIPPPAHCMSPTMFFRKRKMEKELREKGEAQEVIQRPEPKKYQPLSAFMILFIPEIFLGFFHASLLYLQFYSILTVFATALKDSYGLNDLKIGLAYLPNGFGIITASILNGRQLDYYYRKEEKRVGGDYRKKGEEFKIDLTRFRCIIPFGTLFLIASTAQGWCLTAKAPLAATLVVGFFVGLGTGTMGPANLYGQDLQPGKGGAVSASFNLVRCIFGAVGTAVIHLLYDALGAGWTITLLTGISIAGTPILWIIIRYAPGWRAKRVQKEAEKERDKQRKEGEGEQDLQLSEGSGSTRSGDQNVVSEGVDGTDTNNVPGEGKREASAV